MSTKPTLFFCSLSVVLVRRVSSISLVLVCVFCFFFSCVAVSYRYHYYRRGSLGHKKHGSTIYRTRSADFISIFTVVHRRSCEATPKRFFVLFCFSQRCRLLVYAPPFRNFMARLLCDSRSGGGVSTARRVVWLYKSCAAEACVPRLDAI